MDDLQPEFMWKDTGSGGGGCPALYSVRQVPEGYIVQGKKISEGTRALLRQLADDEDAVFVPANVLDRLKDQA
ncbi:hypothetical protein AB0K34_14135 [Actinomadura sp. NPDC049382]|uniref:hypothetical protein n=1 Tax=Actinomadura sp. NPDC049382 TaxID=3158220 RepID=UPI00341CBC80